jgi:hypothetical protein
LKGENSESFCSNYVQELCPRNLVDSEYTVAKRSREEGKKKKGKTRLNLVKRGKQGVIPE